MQENDLVRRASNLSELIADHADESEQLRTLAPALVDVFHESGLFGLWSPAEAGGVDADFVTQLDVLIELARADMSACWSLMIGASSNALMAIGLPEEGFAEVFGGERLPTGAASLRPAGLAQRVDGGYRASGKWGFGSGICHGAWIVANCLAAEDGAPVAPVQPVSLVVPIREVEIHDDWYVAGLSGSGSNSYSINDVFVPDARAMIGAPKRGNSPNVNLVARIPIEHAAVSLGGARHALDVVIEQSMSKVRLGDAGSVAGKQAFQVELGRLESEWRSLRAGVRELAGDLWHALGTSSSDAEALGVELRSVCTHAAERSLAIGGKALRFAGAAAVLESNVLQRIYRDLTVSAQHMMVSDLAYENLGKQQLGLLGERPPGK